MKKNEQPVEHHSGYMGIFEGQTAKYFQNLRKILINLHMQGAQQTPSRLNSETHTKTHHNQTVKAKAKRAS